MTHMTLMADFEAEMAALTDAAAPADVAERLLRTAGDISRQLQSSRTRLIAILDRHVANGGGITPEEALASAGMSGRNARSEANRARAHKKMADALNAEDQGGREEAQDGTPDDDSHDHREHGRSEHEMPLEMPELNPENLDGMARAEKQLALPAEQELFNARRAHLTRQALAMEPAAFKLRLRKLVDRIKVEVAASTEERHRNASQATSWIDADGITPHPHEARPRAR